MVTVQNIHGKVSLVRYTIKFVNICTLECCKFFTVTKIQVFQKCRHAANTNLPTSFPKNRKQSFTFKKSLQASLNNRLFGIYFSSAGEFHYDFTWACPTPLESCLICIRIDQMQVS